MVSTRNSTRFRHVALGVVLALGFVTTAAGAAATDGTHTGGHGAEEQAPDHHGGAQHGYPDVTAASKREIRQADRLRRQVRRAAAKRFPTYRTARRLGYVRFPGRWKRPLVFHLRRHDYDDDGRIFDARRPESLVYWWPKRGTPVLIAMMFRVPKGPRPVFAGPIPVYHQHEGHAGPGNPMTHVWLTHDVRSAWASCLPVPELEAAISRFRYSTPGYFSGRESRACPHTM